MKVNLLLGFYALWDAALFITFGIGYTWIRVYQNSLPHRASTLILGNEKPNVKEIV